MGSASPSVPVWSVEAATEIPALDALEIPSVIKTVLVGALQSEFPVLRATASAELSEMLVVAVVTVVSVIVFQSLVQVDELAVALVPTLALLVCGVFIVVLSALHSR